MTSPTKDPVSATSVNMDDLYARNPGTAEVQPAQIMDTAKAAASTAGSESSQAFNAQTTGFDPELAQVKDEETAAGQLNKITAQDSPLMQRARANAAEYSNSRGLRNSTIAAGATEAAMVDRATPLAQQDAAAYRNQALTNQGFMNRAREFQATAENTAGLQDAQLQSRASEVNAELATDVNKQNAALETNVSLANAQAHNQRLAQNAEFVQRANEMTAGDVNRMRELVISQNAELNRQFLAGTQSMDLATIQGKYQQLISQNETAAGFYDSYFNSISQIMANDQLPPDRVAQYVTAQQNMLESGLRFLDAIQGGTTTNAPAVETNTSGMPPSSIPGTSPTATTPTMTPPPDSSGSYYDAVLRNARFGQ